MPLQESGRRSRLALVVFVLCGVSLLVIAAAAVMERDWFALLLTFFGLVGGLVLGRWLRA